MGNRQGVATLKPPEPWRSNRNYPSSDNKDGWEWKLNWANFDFPDALEDLGTPSYILTKIVENLIQVFDKNPPPEKAISFDQVKEFAESFRWLYPSDPEFYDNAVKGVFKELNEVFGPGTKDAFNNTGSIVTQLRLSPHPLREF